MNATVVKNAIHLPVAERFQLLDCIWSSIARDLEHEPAPVALLDELERRDAAYEADPASGVTLDQMEQHLSAGLKRRLIIVPEARIEIAEAVQQYEGKAPGLGRRFWRETKRCLADVRDNPFRWRAISPKFRRAVMRVFPYLVFFRVTDDEVRVLHVLHGARDYERILAKGEEEGLPRSENE